MILACIIFGFIGYNVWLLFKIDNFLKKITTLFRKDKI